MSVSVDFIESIEKVSCDSRRYDITVKDNHNFVANDILVHNCQNLTKVLPNWYGKTFEVTEKLHGSSQTVYFYDNEYGVCSRNLNLKESDTNTYWKVAREQKLFDVLTKMNEYSGGNSYALQGELIGEGINGNMYNIKGHQFRLFDIYNITEQRYLTPTERSSMWTIYNRNATEMHTPILNNFFVLDEIYTAEKLLQMVEHKSTLNKKVWAEGWVLKCNDVDFSFKVVSNKFLTSKQGEDA
ncbi:MAG: RNA ligase family protein [Bacilli bacterium]|nr:RNA ligase family protein [Bacilli bacterium]